MAACGHRPAGAGTARGRATCGPANKAIAYEVMPVNWPPVMFST
jgi:hypothetical protein